MAGWIDITLAGFAALALGAAMIGICLTLADERPSVHGWLLITLATFAGGMVASELAGLETIEPVRQGVALWPALVGGLVAGVLAEALVGMASGPDSHGARHV